MQLIGIITGDIVASKEIPSFLREQLFDATTQLLEQLKPKWISNYETYRGDSLQCQAIAPELSLRVALMIRSFFKAFIPEEQRQELSQSKEKTKGYFSADYDIRLAIGIGAVDFLKEDKLSSSDGEAFHLSGEGLDSLKQEPQRIIVKTYYPDFNEQVEASILLLDALVQKWTQNQAELVFYKLQEKRDDEIAAQLDISQPAVTQRKKTAQWAAIEKLINYFEKTVQSWTR